MKKVLALFFVALATYGSAHALELKEYTVFYKLNNETTIESLSRYLQLDDQQKGKLLYEMGQNESKIRQAVQNTNVAEAKEAIKLHLNNLKTLLNDEQYNKFISALRSTLDYNKEIEYLAAD